VATLGEQIECQQALDVLGLRCLLANTVVRGLLLRVLAALRQVNLTIDPIRLLSSCPLQMPVIRGSKERLALGGMAALALLAGQAMRQAAWAQDLPPPLHAERSALQVIIS
jgi:hypothetical protein